MKPNFSRTMKRDTRGRVIAGLVTACSVAVLGWVLGSPGIGAEGSQLPGMCQGRSDPNVVLNAHAQSPKLILNVSTDQLGVPYGVLILEKGALRLYADLFCRLWQHLPGQPTGGECEGETPDDAATEPEGATIVHVVGLGNLKDGTAVLVRADLRETEEGKFFRLRYRVMGSHGGHENETIAPAAHDDGGGCEDETWTRFPAEGWAPLKLLKARVVTE
jgi:hypothetical protein